MLYGLGGRQGSRLQDHLQLRLEERKQRQRAKLSAKHSSLKMKTTARSAKTIFSSKVPPNLPASSSAGPSLLGIFTSSVACTYLEISISPYFFNFFLTLKVDFYTKVHE